MSLQKGESALAITTEERPLEKSISVVRRVAPLVLLV